MSNNEIKLEKSVNETKAELENIIATVLQAANTKAKNMFVFSGTNVRTTPF